MTIPRLRTMDDSLRLLRDGYLYGGRGFRHVGADEFHTRLLGRPVTVMRGLDAARFFYEGSRFDRSPGAVPRSAVRLLQDDRSVQTLEGRAHQERKALMLSALAGSDGLVAAFREQWVSRAEASRGEVSLLHFASQVLWCAAAEWAGVDEGAIRVTELTSMIDNAGVVGPPNWIARARRAKTEQTVGDIIRELRRTPEIALPASRIAHHREDGRLLPVQVAAVELLNLLRPVVAVARFVVFAAYALDRQPDAAHGAHDPRGARAFANEVRRFFPFFPMIGGHATQPVEWKGEELPAGAWVMLDLYGTDHHPLQWQSPSRFDPGRFRGNTPAVVAQGFGDDITTHHCPGEPATNDLISAAVGLLLDGPPYHVPEQDLRISLRRFPAAPRDGFRIEFLL